MGRRGAELAALEAALRQSGWLAAVEKGGMPSDGELSSFQIIDTSGTIGRITIACTHAHRLLKYPLTQCPVTAGLTHTDQH